MELKVVHAITAKGFCVVYYVSTPNKEMTSGPLTPGLCNVHRNLPYRCTESRPSGVNVEQTKH